MDEAEHRITAVAASAAEARRLGLTPGAPCLCVERRTRRDGQGVTRVWQTFPVDRYDLVEALRRDGVAMAVATDCNPGTSPVAPMTAALTLACVQFRLTPEEALAGATRHAARALGLADEIGVVAVGKRADLAVWDITRPAELAYWLGKPLLHRRYLDSV